MKHPSKVTREIISARHLIICRAQRWAPLWQWDAMATVYARATRQPVAATRYFGDGFATADAALAFAEECALDFADDLDHDTDGPLGSGRSGDIDDEPAEDTCRGSRDPMIRRCSAAAA